MHLFHLVYLRFSFNTSDIHQLIVFMLMDWFYSCSSSKKHKTRRIFKMLL